MKKNNRKKVTLYPGFKEDLEEVLLDMQAIAIAYDRKRYFLIMTPERSKEISRFCKN